MRDSWPGSVRELSTAWRMLERRNQLEAAGMGIAPLGHVEAELPDLIRQVLAHGQMVTERNHRLAVSLSGFAT